MAGNLVSTLAGPGEMNRDDASPPTAGGAPTMPAMSTFGPIHILRRQPVLFPNRYTWYVLVSALDIMITVTLLVHLGAREVNMIAQRSIELFGTWGLIGLKFMSVILVVGICEWVGRRNLRVGRRVATAAIFISLFPITAAMLQVLFVLAMGDLDWQADPGEVPEFVSPEAVSGYLPGVISPVAPAVAMPAVEGNAGGIRAGD